MSVNWGMKEFLEKVKKIAKRVLIIAIILGLLFVSYMYFGTYSHGDRVGRVMKISEKGLIFKTYEGQLNMKGFGAVQSSNVFSETFEFSVKKSNTEVVEKIQQAMNEGNDVKISYTEHYWKVPWRGDTKHFVTDLTIIPVN